METTHGFLIKVRDEDACQLGTRDNPPVILVFRDVQMNSNRMTNLPVPYYAHEAATKSYVDNNPRKILNSYIPTVKSGGGVGSKSGFVVTSASRKGPCYRAEIVFNDYHAHDAGINGEWTTNSETINFWIQVKCPDLVRVCSVPLRKEI